MTTAWSLFPLGTNDAWLAPLLPLAAFVIIVFWGRLLPKEGAPVAILAILSSWVLFAFALVDLLANGPLSQSLRWLSMPLVQQGTLNFKGFSIDIAVHVDQLSVLMLGLITSVATLIQVYSLGYMKGEPRFGWYFAAHSLFAASMLALVLVDNLLMLYVAWELVGLCSYLLIGFYYERRSAAEAAKKAFVTTRIGDVGLLIGILLLFKLTGTLSISDNLVLVEHGAVAPGSLTLIVLLIFLGAMGKSAQFPFHVWLPDAMEGPTPVSALIHAATMVTAGVYLVARLFPMFEAAPGALTVVAIIGLITALMGATMALVMKDIKRVIAYSTISNLGFMMLALGSGPLGYTAAMFHLVAHGFSKALLFLGSGNVIHGTGTQDIDEMGRLAQFLPATTATFLIGSLSLAGIPPFAGFWSKDGILGAVAEGRGLLFLVPAIVGAFLSALYMARLCWVVFFGPPKPHQVHAHEAPAVMTVPLMVLAIPAALFGFLALDWVGPAFNLKTVAGGFGTYLFTAAEGPQRFHLELPLMLTATTLGLIAVAFAWRIYQLQPGLAWTLSQRFGGFYRLLVNKYYLDDLYQAVIDRVILVGSRFVAVFDRSVVNDVGVNGSGLLTLLAGDRLKYLENGKLYTYALVMAFGTIVAVLVATFLARAQG